MPEDLFAKIRALQMHMIKDPPAKRSTNPRKAHGFCSETNRETKHCSRCQTYKPLAEYTYDKSRWDDLSPYCRSCGKIIAALNAEENRRIRESGQRIDFDKLPDGRNAIRCTSSFVLKPFENFHKDASSLFGKKQQCKECLKKARETKKRSANASA